MRVRQKKLSKTSVCQYCGTVFLTYTINKNGKLSKPRRYCSRRCSRQLDYENRKGTLRYKTVKEAYRVKNKKNIYRRSRAWAEAHPEKYLEMISLRKAYGTAKVPIFVKKLHAFVHLGRRLTGEHCSKPFDITLISKVINQIEEGVTYVAYA